MYLQQIFFCFFCWYQINKIVMYSDYSSLYSYSFIKQVISFSHYKNTVVIRI